MVTPEVFEASPDSSVMLLYTHTDGSLLGKYANPTYLHFKLYDQSRTSPLNGTGTECSTSDPNFRVEMRFVDNWAKQQKPGRLYSIGSILRVSGCMPIPEW